MIQPYQRVKTSGQYDPIGIVLSIDKGIAKVYYGMMDGAPVHRSIPIGELVNAPDSVNSPHPLEEMG